MDTAIPLDYRNIFEKAEERAGNWTEIPTPEGLGDPSHKTVDLMPQVQAATNTLVIPPFVEEAKFSGPWVNGTEVTWEAGAKIDNSGTVARIWPFLYFSRPLIPGQDQVFFQYAE